MLVEDDDEGDDDDRLLSGEGFWESAECAWFWSTEDVSTGGRRSSSSSTANALPDDGT